MLVINIHSLGLGNSLWDCATKDSIIWSSKIELIANDCGLMNRDNPGKYPGSACSSSRVFILGYKSLS